MSMTAQPHDEPGVIAVNDDLDALTALDDWLALVASDEPVTLPRSASAYLQAARETGEV